MIKVSSITLEDYQKLRQVRANEIQVDERLRELGVSCRKSACELLNALVSNVEHPDLSPEIRKDLRNRNRSEWLNRFKLGS